MFLPWALLASLTSAAGQPSPQPSPIIIRAKRPALAVVSKTTSPFKLNEKTTDEQQFRQLSDALTTSPALVVVGSGTLGQQTSVFSRGLSSNHIQVRLDGQRVNSTIDPSGAFDFTNSNLAGLADITLTRGVLSSFYGSNSLGGVLELKSKVGQDAFSQTALVEAGSFRTARGQVGLRGVTNNVHLCILGGRTTTAGFKQTPAAFQKPDIAYPRLPYHQNTVMINGGWRSEAMDITLYNHLTDSFSKYQGFDQAKPLERQQSHHGLELAFKPSTAWHHQLTGGISLDAQTNARKLDTFNKSKGQHWQVNWRHQLEVNSHHKLQVLLESSGDNLEVTTPPQRQHQSQTQLASAAYYQGTFAPITIEAALRAEHYNRFHTPVTGGLGVAYQLLATTKFLANIATTSRVPTLFELYGKSGNFSGNPQLHPERGQGWEAGIVHEFHPKLKAEFTYFNYHIRKLIESTPDFTTYENHHSLKSSGTESLLSWQASQYLLMKIGHCYTKTRDYKGQPLQCRPNHKLVLQARYTQDQWLVASDIIWVGQRYNYNPKISGRDKAKAYATVGFKVGYSLNNNWKVLGRVENLFNRKIEDPISFRKAGLSAYVGLSTKY